MVKGQGLGLLCESDKRLEKREDARRNGTTVDKGMASLHEIKGTYRGETEKVRTPIDSKVHDQKR